MELTDVKQVYFIGIGGIGMSAVARYFHLRGVHVTGYDKTETVLTQTLEREGITIHYGEARLDLVPPPADDLLVVWTPAIPRNFPELVRVQEGAYQLLKRAQVLGLISQGMECVGIAGTHGKTTTTTLTTHLMRTAGLDPSAFLGGIPRDFSGNYVHGNSEYVVVEADEYDRSFLNLHPAIAVILSADPDHLDIYGDHNNMLETGFRAYARQVKDGGHLLVRHELRELFEDIPQVMLTTFGIGAGDFRAQNVQVKDGAFHFDLREPDGHLVLDIRTTLPGRHNVENAVAACAVTRLAGGDEESLRVALASFRGIGRRFDTVLKTEHLVIIDDYAHHPTELEAAIAAARELYPGQTIRGVFQPHLFSRTQDFAAGFAKALDRLDEVILIPIYPAREEPIPGITSRTIYEKMRNEQRRLLSDEQMLEATAELSDGVLLLLGAGDIDKLVPKIVHQHTKPTTHG
ncbi:UDP-N-acetylmuramate--L-alanine ligase [Neolewinella lacunae]|uniref:UDP-N-acetylmuramate--L-alanine ligase n=1 Tax=Neolewinella lacunae TaxID=1517758 RepID=A0A923PNF4_9BACT|nr:UDP-N-acetylmuramate--L-alanine ligase [Neolewinella lacunae]MBC6994519.1 UDP-N-acetylmuramate--L-alanine ligase [Neolewinella lacunae]MDN3634212.1 UDP-N-acetylmuramate--L-alanine ligase [Neolewinella lacunae]